MSLSEAVLEIAEEMTREAQATPDRSSDPRLNMFAKQLKVAVKASETTASPEKIDPAFIHPNAQHFQMIEQARKELREQKRRAEGQELGEVRFAVCHGGPADGDTVSIAPDMPLGAHTLIDGGVYSLQDKGLEYDKVATEARKDVKS